MPAGWELHCTFIKAVKRPPSPAQVSLSYHSHDGHQSIAIWQMAAADRASHHYGGMINDETWQEVTREGTSVRVKPVELGQAQAYLECDGTFVYLISDSLAGDELATIAASLRSAPSTGSI